MSLLAFFDANNLKPGVEVTIKESAAYKGTITLQIADEDVVLGMDVAQNIMITA